MLMQILAQKGKKKNYSVIQKLILMKPSIIEKYAPLKRTNQRRIGVEIP